MKKPTSSILLPLLCTALLLPSQSQSQNDTDTEIRLLIETVATSGCRFERNGKMHDAEDAADHLSLKYRRGKKYAQSADSFIDRLASKSSFSGKPYHIHCPGAPLVTSNAWLHQQLISIRQQPVP